MSRKLSNHLSLTVALVLCAGWLSGCSGNDAPGTTPPPPPQPPATRSVNIHVMQTGSPSVKWIRVDTVGIGLCKYAARCPGNFQFRLVNSPHMSDTDRIRITTASGSATCITPPLPYVLSKADPTQEVAISPSCPDGTKASWLYNVECVDTGGGNCRGILPADPGVIIEGGPAGLAH